MLDREKVIEGLESLHKRLLDAAIQDRIAMLDANIVSDAIVLLKDNGQDEGWLCEKRTSGRQPIDLLCACGNKVYFTTLLFKDGFTANELYCPRCGLSMRSPQQDKNGVWLRKHWEEVVLKLQEPVEPSIDGVMESDCYGSWWYVCAKCKQPIDKGDGYCRWCGKAVKWDG